MENEIKVNIVGDSKYFEMAIRNTENHLHIFENSVCQITNNIKNQFNTITSTITAVGVGFQAARTATIDFIVTPLSYAVNAFMEFGDQLSKTSQRIGMSVETLGGLKFAAEQCGSNFEEMTDAVKTFQEQLGAAKLGDTGAIDKLGAVGIRAEDFDGLSSEEQFLKLADHIRQIGDRAEQTRTAIELFGDAGFRLLPFFQEGKEGIRKLIEEGKEIGAVLGEESAQNAVELADSMNRVKTSFNNVCITLTSLLAPALTGLLDISSNLISQTAQFISNNAALLIGLGAGAGAFLLYANNAFLLTKALAGLKIAMTAIASHPFLLIGGAAAAGLLLWANAAREAMKETYRLNEAAAEHTAKVEEMNDADQHRIKRLEELQAISENDTLKNSEMEEANRLIKSLTDRYGELGIEIDKDTGKITGLAEAQKKMAEAQNRAVVMAKTAEIEEAKANIKKIDDEIAWRTTYRARMAGQGFFGESELQQKYSERDVQMAKIRAARSAIWAIEGGPDEEETSDAAETSETSGMSEAELEADNKSKRNAQAAAREKLAALPDDPDLDFRSDLEKAYAKLDEEVQKKYSELDKKIKLAEEAGVNTESLYDGYNDIERWRQEQLAEIHNEAIAKQQEQGDAEYAKWQEQNPELLELPSEDIRLTNAKKNVSAAEDIVADAVINGGNVEAADEGLRKAKLELAQTVAKVSGEARAKAKTEYEALQNKYELAKKKGAGNDELNQLWKALEEAGKRLEEENSKYFSAVAEIRGLRPDEPLPEEEVQDAVQTSMRVSGAFSAYGLEAAAAGTNIAMETLDYIKRIFGQVEEVKNNQTAGVLE